jgi:hypothetical protein
LRLGAVTKVSSFDIGLAYANIAQAARSEGPAECLYGRHGLTKADPRRGTLKPPAALLKMHSKRAHDLYMRARHKATGCVVRQLLNVRSRGGRH